MTSRRVAEGVARLAKETPYLLPLVDAVKRGVTMCMPLKCEAFSPPRSARAILWLRDLPSGGPGDFDADSLRCFTEICLYRFVIGTDEPEPTTYQRAANYAVSGENVMIIETDAKHAEEWGEFLSSIPFVVVN